MKPARFEYVAPTTLDAAVAVLAAAGGEGKVLAGGQSLLPLLNFRMARPAVLVDLNGIKDLSFIELRGDSVVIGALTRHSRDRAFAADRGHAAGDVGGHAPRGPSRDSQPWHYRRQPLACGPGGRTADDGHVLRREFAVQGQAGRRAIAARDFFVDALTNCLEPEDIVTEIEFPILQHDGVGVRGSGATLRRFCAREHRGIDPTRPLRDQNARVAVMGVADTPLRLEDVEERLVEIEVDGRMPDRFSESVTSSVTPNSDLHVSAEYRKHLLGELAKRAMRTALAAKERSEMTVNVSVTVNGTA